ncbi:MAG: PH domain-containing protein [Lachnospiraceae bacterium]|nr:PH domain-containing protein [Lachnospiraceae bacterium]
MAEETKLPFELAEGEELEKTFASDYWEKFLFTRSQVRGRYWFTNQRILFGTWGMIKVEIPYNKISAAVTCNVGLFIPTGIKLTMDDGTVHVLSVTKRSENLDFIKAKMLHF